jgi:hypothetical protein
VISRQIVVVGVAIAEVILPRHRYSPEMGD